MYNMKCVHIYIHNLQLVEAGQYLVNVQSIRCKGLTSIYNVDNYNTKNNQDTRQPQFRYISNYKECNIKQTQIDLDNTNPK